MLWSKHFLLSSNWMNLTKKIWQQWGWNSGPCSQFSTVLPLQQKVICGCQKLKIAPSSAPSWILQVIRYQKCLPDQSIQYGNMIERTFSVQSDISHLGCVSSQSLLQCYKLKARFCWFKSKYQFASFVVLIHMVSSFLCILWSKERLDKSSCSFGAIWEPSIINRV